MIDYLLLLFFASDTLENKFLHCEIIPPNGIRYFFDFTRSLNHSMAKSNSRNQDRMALTSPPYFASRFHHLTYASEH